MSRPTNLSEYFSPSFRNSSSNFTQMDKIKTTMDTNEDDAYKHF